MNYCPNCGNPIPDGTNFCQMCGYNIPYSPAPMYQNYQQPMQQQMQQQQPMPPCPPTYLALSIIVTILCCLPFGIVGIIKSSSVTKEYAAGHYDEAQRASKQAKTWSIVGICTALFWVIIYFILLAFGVLAGVGFSGLDF